MGAHGAAGEFAGIITRARRGARDYHTTMTTVAAGVSAGQADATEADQYPRMCVRCRKCRYDLAHTARERVCPECGTPASWANRYYLPAPAADVDRWHTGTVLVLIAALTLNLVTPFCLGMLQEGWGRSRQHFVYGYLGAVGIITIFAFALAAACTWALKPDVTLPRNSPFRRAALAMVWTSLVVYLVSLGIASWFVREFGIDNTLRIAYLTGLHFCIFAVGATLERLARGQGDARQWEAQRNCRRAMVGFICIFIGGIVYLAMARRFRVELGLPAFALAMILFVASCFQWNFMAASFNDYLRGVTNQ